MKHGVQKLTMPMLQAGLLAVEPKVRISLLLAGLIATADELHVDEQELMRMVRVSLCQRSIALEVMRKGAGAILDRQGKPMMPTGTASIGLAQTTRWECPLCGSQVPVGVKHKHTANEWMTGKRVLPDEPAIGEGDCSIGPPAGELEEARRDREEENSSLGRAGRAGESSRTAVSSEEARTVNEGVKRRERGGEDVYAADLEGPGDTGAVRGA